MARTLEDLRDHLFATLDALRDKENPMEIERAKAIGEVARGVIESAKVEVAYVKAVGRDDMILPVLGALPAPGKTPPDQSGPRVTTHRIK